MSDNISFDFTKPNRTVHSVFLHCSASDRPEHDSVNVIKKWHMARGFSGIGYHYFIHKNGVISNGRCLSKIPAAQRNYNSGSIAICLHGLKREKFTEKQYVSLRKLCSAIDSAYDNKLRFRGHCEVAAKSCPVFDYKKELNLSDEGKLQSSLLHSPMNLAQLRQNTCALFSTGSRVRVIQGYLKVLGFPIVVDGVFGACSRQIAEVVARENKVKLSNDFSFIDLEQAIVLKVGSKGPQVKKLQNFLKIKGFNLKSDGIYSENTKAAVISFQRANQLHTDGIVGINTVKKMIAKV